MKLIVGLGNPGKEYEKTRHNAGFMAVDYFAEANHWPDFKNSPDRRSEVSEHSVDRQKVLLVKPQTMMNDSGLAVQDLVRFYKAALTDVLVIYDELALPFGKVRAREGGSSAGHQGVESIIKASGDGFVRLRIGISNKDAEKRSATNFVLERFAPKEEDSLPQIFDYVNHHIHEFITTSQLPPHTEDVLKPLF